MNHLHDRVAALVDGELSRAGLCRATAHLQHCEACRAAVEAERATRQMTAQAAPVEPSQALVARLLAIGGPQGPLRPRDGHVPGTPRVSALPAPGAAVPPRVRTVRPPGRRSSPQPMSTAPPTRVPAGRRARRTRRVLAAAVLGTVSLATVGVLGVGLVAGTVQLPAAADPVFGRLVVERAGVAGDTRVVPPVATLPAADPTGADVAPEPSQRP